MSDSCDHSKYSTSYDMCFTPGHPVDCVVDKCDNCGKDLTHDFASFDIPRSESNTSLGQQFRDIVYFGGATDALQTKPCENCGTAITKENAAKNGGFCDECDSTFSSPIDDEHESGYRCRVCNKWFETDDENMNHRCFE